jgi:uncharacterized membrane protein YdjX (TVP38/TMEM64 family)
MPQTLKRLLITFAGLAFIAIVGGWTRDRLGIALDVESVRAFANDLGPAGPLLFVLVVAGRSLLWLPSQVVLIAAGLCFGTVVGALVGGAGLMISGLVLFLAARYAGRDVIERRLGDRVRGLLDFTSRRSGAVAFGIACGYPISPLSPMQAAAGWTQMAVGHFIASAFIGGAIRASIFAYFGNALLQASWASLAAPVAVFGFALAIPLAFPSGRAWLRDLLARPKPAAAVSPLPVGEGGSAPNQP